MVKPIRNTYLGTLKHDWVSIVCYWANINVFISASGNNWNSKVVFYNKTICLLWLGCFNRVCVESVRIRSFSGSYFPVFGLNTERYSVSPSIQSECGEIQTRKTLNTGTFCAVRDLLFYLHDKMNIKVYNMEKVKPLDVIKAKFYDVIFLNIFLPGSYVLKLFRIYEIVDICSSH